MKYSKFDFGGGCTAQLYKYTKIHGNVHFERVVLWHMTHISKIHFKKKERRECPKPCLLHCIAKTNIVNLLTQQGYLKLKLKSCHLYQLLPSCQLGKFQGF